MARQLRIEFEHAFYHITARGTEKKSIFLDRNDRNRFMFYLHENQQRYDVVNYAYVLMRNHYHLFLETIRANLSRFMHDLNTSYTVYFNRRQARVGPLFQGRYKAILVDSEKYMLELTRYIHLNPIRAKLLASPEEYLWSSYRVYLGKDADQFVSTTWAKERFGRRWRRGYRDFIEQGMAGKDPFENLKAGFILGSDKFVDKIKSMLTGKKVDKEIPATKNLVGLKLNEIIDETSRYFQINRSDIVKRKRGFLPRKVALYLARKLTQASINEIAEAFGIYHSAVSKAVSRLRDETNRNEKTKKIIEDIERACLCL